MPNWCSNTLTVTGPREAIAAFARKANGPTSSYNNFMGQNWESLDDIRIAAIAATLPEPGEVSELSFHALCPVPELIRKLGFDDGVAKRTAEAIGVDYPGMGGYRWQVNNWGTKWEPSISYADIQDDYAQYEFDTAWSPPTALLEKVSEDFPELTFDLSYREEGMGFQGEAQYHNGDLTFLDESDIEYTEEEEE